MLNKLKGGIKKMFQASNPPMGEIATTESAIYKDLGFREYNPDSLIRSKGFSKTYDEMRVDDEVKASLSLKKHAVLAPGWEIEPASEDDEDQEKAEFIETVFEQMGGALDDALLQILTALDYGYSITEIIWGVMEEGQYKGKVGIKALKSKRPHLYEFDTDEYANLKPKGLVQTGLGMADEKALPVNKFIIYSYQKEFGNWYGMSDLRASYRSWWSKDNIIKFWNIYLERFGSPLTVGKYKTANTASITDLKNILNNLQSKTSITHRDGEFDLSFLEPQRRSTADYQAALDYHNKSIARSILLPDRLSSAGETGAYAQAKVHFDVFLWVIQKLRLDLESVVMQEQLIRRLMGWNYPDAGQLPKFKFRPLTEEQRLALADAFATAVQKGAVVATSEDGNHIRKALNFPEQEEAEIPQPGPKETPTKPKEEGTPADAETGDGEKKSMSGLWREKTQYEKKVDFARIETDLDKIETDAISDLQTVLEKQKNALTAFVANKISNNKLTSRLIMTGIDLKYTRELKTIVSGMFSLTYVKGKKDASAEIPKRFIKAKRDIAVTPQKALDYFEAKTGFVVKGIKDPLVSEIQAVLLSTLRDGLSVPDTIKRLEDVYLPYLSAGDIIIDQKQLTPYRMEAIIRTNMSEAYNFGRRAIGEDPDLEGYVIGYQFSEIIDARTAEVSQYVDGKIISVKHPSLSSLSYPLHWNERGMFVFITTDEAPVTMMSDAEVSRAISLKGI